VQDPHRSDCRKLRPKPIVHGKVCAGARYRAEAHSRRAHPAMFTATSLGSRLAVKPFNMTKTLKLCTLPADTVVPSSGMLERVGGDRELLAEVIQFFLEDCPPMIELMRQGLADGNYIAVHRTAHSLTGSAGNFDATAVTTLARTLEAHAIAHDLPEAQQAFAELETETSQLLTRLTAILATL
jgi:HPt (histidine-containing phosphotransfer) domain-containing protein